MTGFTPLGVVPLATLEGPAAPPETITPDKWLQQGARQPRAAPVAAAVLASGFAWSGFTPAPPPETVTVDKWLPTQVRPVRENPRPRGATAFVAPAPDFITVDRWLPTQTRPVRENPRPRGAVAFVVPAPDFITADRWLPAQARPVVQPRALRSAHTEPVELTSVHGWRAPQSRPAYPSAVPRGGLAQAAFVEAPAEVITPDKWLAAAVRPAALPRAPALPPVWAPTATLPDITLDEWWQHPARPVASAWRPVAHLAWVAFVDAAPEVITADKWLPWATRPDYRAHFTGRQTIVEPPWDTSSPPEPGVVAEWHQRVRRRRG